MIKRTLLIGLLKKEFIWKSLIPYSILISNVHIRSQRGDKFDTDLLFWDEKQERVYSDKFIRIEQEDKIITGYGFESNQQMTEYQIYNNTGIFTVEDTAPADSTKAVANSTRTDSIR